MRQITKIIIHCSAIRPDQTSSAKQIDRWHKAKGWAMIGYHYVVRRDGTIEEGRPLEMAGAHTAGHNAHSIGVCYEGGLDAQGRPADTRTPEQKYSLMVLLRSIQLFYPHATIHGHNEFAPKSCPCFDVAKEFGENL